LIQASRIRHRRQGEAASSGRYVLYWMQRAQRAGFNHALEYAVDRANQLALPVVVGFGLMDDYPEANQRHYAFMLEGLREAAQSLRERGITFVQRHGHPADTMSALAADAALLVCDRGYLRHEKPWREAVAAAVRCPLVEIETDVIVPVERASNKAESTARTLRPKIGRLLDEYLHALEPAMPRHRSPELRLASDLDQQQISARRPRRQFLRRRRLDLRPARPALVRSADLRHGALHERARAGAQIRHRRLRCKSRAPLLTLAPSQP
jgi:deoxyribodipyrimidine photolyase